MSFKRTLPQNLEHSVKVCPIDFQRIENLMRRAIKDLRSAQIIQESDLEAAYQLVYDSMLHSALGYMISEGVQPDIQGKHKIIIQYVSHALGKRYEFKMQFYDRMRRRRHQLLYEPGPFQCTEKEIADAQKVAKEFVILISEKIKEKSPQKEFDFGIEV